MSRKGLKQLSWVLNSVGAAHDQGNGSDQCDEDTESHHSAQINLGQFVSGLNCKRLVHGLPFDLNCLRWMEFSLAKFTLLHKRSVN